VTLDSFYYTENFPQLAANKRPIWAIEAGPGKVPKRFVESQAVSPPGGAQTNYVSTWALGPLAPGHIQTFVWHVAPLKAGMHTVHYTDAAGPAMGHDADAPAQHRPHRPEVARPRREPDHDHRERGPQVCTRVNPCPQHLRPRAAALRRPFRGQILEQLLELAPRARRQCRLHPRGELIGAEPPGAGMLAQLVHGLLAFRVGAADVTLARRPA